MKIDVLSPVRLAMLILFLIGTRGTPFYWIGFYFLLKEIAIYIKIRR